MDARQTTGKRFASPPPRAIASPQALVVRTALPAAAIFSGTRGSRATVKAEHSGNSTFAGENPLLTAILRDNKRRSSPKSL